MCRIYFNKAGNENKIWSIDFGPNTMEMLYKSLSIEAGGTQKRVGTDTRIGESDPDCPKAWMVAKDVEVELNWKTCEVTVRL